MQIFIAFLLTLLLLSACCDQNESTTEESPKIKIRFSHAAGKDSAKGIGANMFKRLVKEDQFLESKGVVVEVYPNSLLYKDDEVMHALESGKVQITALPPSKLIEYNKNFLASWKALLTVSSISQLTEYNNNLQIFDLPFLFEDIEVASLFMEQMKNEKFLLKAPHYISLDYWYNGMTQFSNNQKLLMEPADFEELTIKTWSNYYFEKGGKDQTYFTEINYAFLGDLLVVNAQFWEGLDNEVRNRLKGILNDVTIEVNKLVKELNESSRQKIFEKKKSSIFFVEDNLNIWNKREKWCQAIYKQGLKESLNEIDYDIFEAIKTANKEKTRCPFSYFIY